MKRDVMEGAGLEWFAEIGIIIFFVVFILILFRVAFMKKEKTEKAKQIPLEEERVVTGGTGEEKETRESNESEAPA